MHRESWLAWFGWGAVTLCVFALVWFCGVFHLLLKLPIRVLVQPFIVLSIIVAAFAAAGKISRERFINREQVAPMVVAVLSMFQFVIWSFGYYASRLGFISHSDLTFVYFVTPALMLATGVASYYLVRKALVRGHLKLRL